MNDGDDEKDGKGDDKKDCFKLLFPISITMPDGSILTGEEKELLESIKLWYNDNADVKEKPSFNYPVEISWPEKDIIKTINNSEEMAIAKKYCDSDKYDKEKECFKLVYPITWTMPDGSNITLTSGKDYDQLKQWYESHPDVKAKPVLIFPVEIIWPDKDIVKTINNNEELEAAKKDCD
jgi:hypothetical protein